VIETSCQGCVFSKNDKDGKQESCQMDRLGKLESYRNDEEEFFRVKRFCNAFRPNQWLNDLSLEESLSITDTVKKEIVPRVGILIDFDTELEDPLSKLKDCIGFGYKDVTADVEEFDADYDLRWIKVKNFVYNKME